jgi:hypothetical protein
MSTTDPAADRLNIVEDWQDDEMPAEPQQAESEPVPQEQISKELLGMQYRFHENIWWLMKRGAYNAYEGRMKKDATKRATSDQKRLTEARELISTSAEGKKLARLSGPAQGEFLQARLQVAEHQRQVDILQDAIQKGVKGKKALATLREKLQAAQTLWKEAEADLQATFGQEDQETKRLEHAHRELFKLLAEHAPQRCTDVQDALIKAASSNSNALVQLLNATPSIPDTARQKMAECVGVLCNEAQDTSSSFWRGAARAAGTLALGLAWLSPTFRAYVSGPQQKETGITKAGRAAFVLERAAAERSTSRLPLQAQLHGMVDLAIGHTVSIDGVDYAVLATARTAGRHCLQLVNTTKTSDRFLLDVTDEKNIILRPTVPGAAEQKATAHLERGSHLPRFTTKERVRTLGATEKMAQDLLKTCHQGTLEQCQDLAHELTLRLKGNPQAPRIATLLAERLSLDGADVTITWTTDALKVEPVTTDPLQDVRPAILVAFDDTAKRRGLQVETDLNATLARLQPAYARLPRKRACVAALTKRLQAAGLRGKVIDQNGQLAVQLDQGTAPLDHCDPRMCDALKTAAMSTDADRSDQVEDAVTALSVDIIGLADTQRTAAIAALNTLLTDAGVTDITITQVGDDLKATVTPAPVPDFDAAQAQVQILVAAPDTDVVNALIAVQAAYDLAGNKADFLTKLNLALQARSPQLQLRDVSGQLERVPTAIEQIDADLTALATATNPADIARLLQVIQPTFTALTSTTERRNLLKEMNQRLQTHPGQLTLKADAGELQVKLTAVEGVVFALSTVLREHAKPGNESSDPWWQAFGKAQYLMLKQVHAPLLRQLASLLTDPAKTEIEQCAIIFETIIRDDGSFTSRTDLQGVLQRLSTLLHP